MCCDIKASELGGMENIQVLVVHNSVSEWERKWSLISISFNIDSSLRLVFPVTFARVSLIKLNKAMEYNLLAGKNSKANTRTIDQTAL